MNDWFISWGTKLFYPNRSPSRAASSLARHGAYQRKLSQREKLINTTRKLREELGLPDDRRLVL